MNRILYWLMDSFFMVYQPVPGYLTPEHILARWNFEGGDNNSLLIKMLIIKS